MQLAGGALSIHDDSDLPGGESSAWRVEQAPGPAGRFLNVIAVASGSAPQLEAEAVATTDSVHGAVIGTQVVVFSAQGRGAAAPLPFSYSLQGVSPRTHTIANLGAAVNVDVTKSAGQTTVTVATGDQHTPNAAGVVRFADGG